MISPSASNLKSDCTRFTTRLPVAPNVYVAIHRAEPACASAFASGTSTAKSVARAVSIRHMSPAWSPWRSGNTGSENSASGA